MKIPISVIIRTSNSEQALARLLGRLERDAEDEIIIVDTRSQDGTLAVAEQAGARIVLNSDPFNYSRTLNLGFAAAKNNWALALSAHCIPIRADLLDAYRAALAEVPEDTASLYGLQFWSQPQYEQADKATRVFASTRQGDVPGASNCNALYSRAAWLQHPFDETLPTAEDLEWQRWARLAGLPSAVAPSAAVFYLHQGSPSYRFSKAWGETLIMGEEMTPMSFLGLFQGVAQATKRLLWEARAPRPWVGQIAHQLGSFLASRTGHASPK